MGSDKQKSETGQPASESLFVTEQMAAHTQTRPALKRIHVVINPAAGQDQPVLKILNRAFQPAELEWSISITQRAGDATRQAREAAESGVDAVAVCGGDGSIVEAANGLIGTDVPLAILPGGTANVLAIELGVPRDLSRAAELLTQGEVSVRGVDMGCVGDDSHFFHLGMGIEAEMVRFADRETKESSGVMAYVFGVLREIGNMPVSHYRLTLDGETVEVDGVNCMITNFGSIGIAGLKLANTIDMSDGLLDVLVIQNANLKSVLQAAASAIRKGAMGGEPLLQWQVREVTVEADPPQAVVRDGDLVEVPDLAVRVVPQAVGVIVPTILRNAIL